MTTILKTFDQCAKRVSDITQPNELGELPYIGLEHILQGGLQLLGNGTASEVVSTKLKFRTGDILFGKLRPYFRKVIIAPFDGVCSTDIWVVRAKEGVDQRYLFYWMASLEFVEAATRASEGTKMPRAKWEYVCQLKKYIPSLPEQRRIAETLGSLDDKIELNRKMNHTLEGMAHAIFKSWFVDFDPVRAKMEGRQPAGMDAETAALFPDAMVGDVPQGWRTINLGEVIVNFDSKRVPLPSRERELRQGVYPYYGAASIMDHIDDYLFDGIYVLLAEDGTVVDDNDHPILQYVWGKFWVNNHAHVLRGKNGINCEQLLLFLNNINIRPYMTGAVQAKVNQANMNSIPFLLPTIQVCQKFQEIISPFYAKIRANSEEIHALIELRDLLLPKLMSGEIKVKA